MATNAERTTQTRTRLVAEARRLFAALGYAATSTDAILEAAGVKRGALYHHFADKAALLEAVCLQIAEQAAEAIDAATADVKSPLRALERGSVAWVAFMTRPEVARIALIDGPSVIGWARWQEMDRQFGYRALLEAMHAAIEAGELANGGDVELHAVMVNGALNALALHLVSAAPRPRPKVWQASIERFWRAGARVP